MLWYRKRKRFDGGNALDLLLGYGVGRFWIEGLRTDQLKVPGTALAVAASFRYFGGSGSGSFDLSL